ncbi:MAG: DUF1566 domain-containing protein [Nitrospirae bacterium]|nr:DUF1566 domain-containing protein [Nitrospirota bacterium]
MTDTITNLQWMKKSDGCNGEVTQGDRNTCVPSGWRLPTIQELYSLCREDGTTTGLDAMLRSGSVGYCNDTLVDRRSELTSAGFTNVKSLYWSSTISSGSSYAWSVYMDSGRLNYGADSTLGYAYVWPVRSGH